MAKNKTIRKQEKEMDLDFFDSMESHSPEEMASFLTGMVEASHHQQLTAIELTKLVVANNGEKMAAKEIFSVFLQASQVANESTALKAFWEKMQD